MDEFASKKCFTIHNTTVLSYPSQFIVTEPALYGYEYPNSFLICPIASKTSSCFSSHNWENIVLCYGGHSFYLKECLNETKMSSKKYNISNIKQLIDLNGPHVNFLLNFKVVSVSNEPFDAVVMTQEMLDAGNPIEYQRAEGNITGQIKNDNGIYSNYLLILKSDKPMEVDVVSELQELPLAVPPSPQQEGQQQQQPVKKKKVKENFEDSSFSFTTKVMIFIGVFLLCLAAYGIYYIYFRKPAAALPATPTIDIKEVTDGLNILGVKLDEVTSGVTSNLSKIEHNISENLQELKGKIPDNSSDITDIKKSLNEMKPNWEQLHHNMAPPSSSSLTTSAVDNAEEILTKLNSYKILNKQA